MRARIIFFVAFLMLFCGTALAESREISGHCRYTATVRNEHARRTGNDDYSSYWEGTGGALTVRLPEDTTACGIQLSFLERATPGTVEALAGNGAVTDETGYSERYLNAYIPLRSSAAYRIRAREANASLRVNRVRVFAGEDEPADAQRWREPAGPVDLLHIVAHPDDELIWFGGLLPTYAGERRMNVLVAYAVTRGALKAGRFNELLDGLWVCGVRAYPVLGPFADFQAKTLKTVFNHWGEDAAQAWCTGLIRRYRPRVVVTHDLRGESGHMQHQAVARAVTDAVTAWSGNAAFDPDSAAEYGTYTPQKLYMHRYRRNEIFMDWDRPLSAFGGRTGAQVAREAFRRHVSQRRTHYKIYMSGPMDSRYLGLYFSTVGDDVKKNDLFENVRDTGTP